jgi:hypothetical protein
VWHPAVTIKMLCMIDRERLTAFCLSDKSFTGQAVANFTSSVLHHAARIMPTDASSYLVLDNAPKNRTQKMKDIAALSGTTLAYITPTTPEHNMIENFFFGVKKNFAKLKHLQATNISLNPRVSMAHHILHALHLTATKDFSQVQKMFLGSLGHLLQQDSKAPFKD